MANEAYENVMPVLIGDRKAALTVAKRLYLNFSIAPHWFGESGLFGGAPYLRAHSWKNSFSDRAKLELLSIFVSEYTAGYIPVLIPCDDESMLFCNKNLDEIESRFVIADKSRILALTAQGSLLPESLLFG